MKITTITSQARSLRQRALGLKIPLRTMMTCLLLAAGLRMHSS